MIGLLEMGVGEEEEHFLQLALHDLSSFFHSQHVHLISYGRSVCLKEVIWKELHRVGVHDADVLATWRILCAQLLNSEKVEKIIKVQ